MTKQIGRAGAAVSSCRRAALGLVLVGTVIATPALADRIDGEWCDGSRHFIINGPTIVTPGGSSIQGQYGRHDFKYTIPESEPGAGGTVDMRLINDDNVNVNYGSEPPKVWRRCKVTS